MELLFELLLILTFAYGVNRLTRWMASATLRRFSTKRKLA